MSMTQTTDPVRLAADLRARRATGRLIVAVAGAPGSGKSTFADTLVAGLNEGAPGTAAVLPMDGYHYDDLYLQPAGLLPRKGAPHTFDVGGFYHTLQRLRARDERQVAVPVFDRKIEVARAGARLIGADVPVIVAEGNYLLLAADPWARLRPMFDLTVMIEVTEPVLRARLARRWEGFGMTEEEMTRKLEQNDLPNGRLVRTDSAPADYRIVG